MADKVTTVAEYYDATAESYRKHIGLTCQAGLIPGYDPDPYLSTNIYIAERAGLATGMRVLDAGCGLCGPSIDLASRVEGLRIAAVTISEAQLCIGKHEVARRGLTDTIDIQLGDFHRLPYEADTFDRALSIEAAGHSHDLLLLFKELYRTVRPGGKVYVKDVFCPDRRLSSEELLELKEFERIYAYQCRPIREYVEAMVDAGFRSIESKALESVSTSKFDQAMWEDGVEKRQLNEFGRVHYRKFVVLPVFFGELLGTREPAV